MTADAVHPWHMVSPARDGKWPAFPEGWPSPGRDLVVQPWLIHVEPTRSESQVVGGRRWQEYTSRVYIYVYIYICIYVYMIYIYMYIYMYIYIYIYPIHSNISPYPEYE